MAAGQGTRMKSATPKHLHPLLGRRLADWAIAAVRPLDPDPHPGVAAPQAADAVHGATGAVHQQPLGTGDAVRTAKAFVGEAGSVIVASADHPLLTEDVLRQLVEQHRATGAAATVLSFEPPD